MSKMRKKSGDSGRQERTLNPGEVSIIREVDYIIQRAQEQEIRVVTLGALVLFSTATGDAWLLDPEDRCALCLAREGVRQPVRIVETEDRFAIDWDRTYRIVGELFTVLDRSHRKTAVLGYPVREIEGAVELLQQRGLLSAPQRANSGNIDQPDDESNMPEMQVDLTSQLEAMRRRFQVPPNPSASGLPARPTSSRPHGQKLGRNDPCWCGSDKKYKHCHMRQDMQ